MTLKNVPCSVVFPGELPFTIVAGAPMATGSVARSLTAGSAHCGYCVHGSHLLLELRSPRRYHGQRRSSANVVAPAAALPAGAERRPRARPLAAQRSRRSCLSALVRPAGDIPRRPPTTPRCGTAGAPASGHHRRQSHVNGRVNSVDRLMHPSRSRKGQKFRALILHACGKVRKVDAKWPLGFGTRRS